MSATWIVGCSTHMNEHISSTNLGVTAFDAVKAFFDRRSRYNEVQLIVAEDNEAVIKILAKGRSAKMRHIHRTHRVNTDWLYEAFRRPEVLARYVNTDLQIADLGTKAICKGETWTRLTRMMGIRLPDLMEEPGTATKSLKNKDGLATATQPTNNNGYSN